MTARFAALAALALARALALAADPCRDEGDFYRSLPREIGIEDQKGKHPYAMPCDTMVVRKGVTATVHGGSLLYFRQPRATSIIKVDGTLILDGDKNRFVYLSGSLDSSNFDYRPGDRTWGGVEVSPGGRLEMRYAGVFRAPTPVTTFSTQVKITNCFFQGGTGIILPDGTLRPLVEKWDAINDLDLEARSVASRDSARQSTERARRQAERERAAQRNAWIWGGAAAALIAGGGGAGYYLWQNHHGDHANQPLIDRDPNQDLPLPAAK